MSSHLHLSSRHQHNRILSLDDGWLRSCCVFRSMLIGRRLTSWLVTQVVRSNRKNKSFPRELRQSLFSFRILQVRDRKSTRLNSSHVSISYAVFCLKKKNNH